MDTQNGRTAEPTGLLPADPFAEPFTGSLTDSLSDSLTDPFGFAEPLAELIEGARPDEEEDPGWDYEDVILRSVN
ncbi:MULTISPECIES: hypothetical protein [Kitasatospora]|uniref:Uncharacterized protein n=1 Tax=Kitasatospora setae (strain ATCC 33774 / DSM 43861 / JCM 3304 / KCC A-0304 / NBRC 14216 / KM-6054) TaxID=452652 RepID=E4NJ61_KITSK|nr:MULTISPECIES: hypothetical protein [Kitasatospora]BAJ33009.1 hypothetical protein KSE_72540 [Kitasatospora setae KM-6054]